jgi:uncharacterized membrane protein
VSRYDVLLFLHIAFAILWLGSGSCLILLAFRAEASNDPRRIKQIAEDAGWVAHRLIIPSSLAVLALGVWLVVDGPWTFDMLWVDLGLAGFATTFAIGFFVLTPLTKRVSETMTRDGGLSAEAAEQVRLLFLISRIDLVVLFAVVAVMALKPTADDAGALVLLAAAIASVSAYSVWRLRQGKTVTTEPVGDVTGG